MAAPQRRLPGQPQAGGAYLATRRAESARKAAETGTGGAGICVVDIDAKSGGFETWDLLRDENPEHIETVTVETGGGRQHLWFIYPPDVEISKIKMLKLARRYLIRLCFIYPPFMTLGNQ